MGFHVYTRSELRKLPPLRWIMKGVIAEGSLGWLISEWGHGKSFVAIDWAAHIVLGRNWHGHKVCQANVLYVSAEGLPGKRLDAWEQHFGTEVPDGLVVLDGIDLQDADDIQTVMDVIEDHEIGLLFYDTQHAVNGGETEEEAAEAQEGLREIRREYPSIAQFLVHHRGKDASRGGRGTSAWPAALDMIYEIDASDPHELMTLKRTKQRDEGYFPPMGLRLETVVLGEDADGDEITSCVVVEAAAMEEDNRSDTEKIIWALKIAGAMGDEVAKSEIAQKAKIRAADAKAALAVLVEENRVTIDAVKTRGRPREVLRLVN
jgi:AAA domain